MSLPHKKNFLRDVLPKSSIEKPRRKKNDDEDEKVHYQTESVSQIKDYDFGAANKSGRWRIWAMASIAVLGLVIAVLYVFSSAEVKVIPRIDEVRFNQDFKAMKELTSLTERQLVFAVQKVENIGSKNVSADGEKMQEKQLEKKKKHLSLS